MISRDATTALRRFGLGARPGEVAKIGNDPRGFVVGQLKEASSAMLAGSELEPSDQIFVAAKKAQMEEKLRREAEARATLEAAAAKDTKVASADPGKAPAGPVPQPPVTAPPALKPGQVRREALLIDADARFERALSTSTPMLERLVMFWSNHFCVAVNKGEVRGIAGAYEREAIRPHVLGNFFDLLKAVEQHPAMLIFLDNQVSIGPNSPVGQRARRGLNENLAREIMELHTLGVDGGYTQADVTSFARIITGWTVGQLNNDGPGAIPGRYFFGPGRHEPGEHTVLGKRYPDRGALTGVDVLYDLANHPATARHIARKLAAHFIGTPPPQPVVDALAKRFRDTQGDLFEVTLALVKSEAAWSTPQRKIVPPYDHIVQVSRALGLDPKPGEVLRLSNAFGQQLWNPPSPQGWPDDDDAWMGPAAMRERLRVAERAARECDKTIDPRERAEDLLGPVMTADTREAIKRAEAREQGLEILLMAPEMQRR